MVSTTTPLALLLGKSHVRNLYCALGKNLPDLPNVLRFSVHRPPTRHYLHKVMSKIKDTKQIEPRQRSLQLYRRKNQHRCATLKGLKQLILLNSYRYCDLDKIHPRRRWLILRMCRRYSCCGICPQNALLDSAHPRLTAPTEYRRLLYLSDTLCLTYRA